MKKLVQFSMLAFLFSFAIACSNAPEGEKVEAETAKEAPAAPVSAQMYEVDIDRSVVRWVGSKPTGTHEGTLNISSGMLSMQGENIVGGDFAFDMTSIKNTDLPAEKQADLEGHLMAGDFFEVEKFPAGSFKITAVKAGSDVAGATHSITGNLTLKGITKSVTLPTSVKSDGNIVKAVTPSFTINRTEWDIVYASAGIGTIKDKIINDEIGLVLEIVASIKSVQ
ncbi:MAG: polyisoprenoid-binding protein YceI [Paraglaciecola sp.]|jgi:polyisoprenoid-binding protein YceI